MKKLADDLVPFYDFEGLFTKSIIMSYYVLSNDWIYSNGGRGGARELHDFV